MTRVGFLAPPGDGSVPIRIAGSSGLLTNGQRDDARLGAGYSRVKDRDERDPDESRNAVVPMPSVVSRMRMRHEADEESTPPPAQLFAIRMVSERAPGERASGLLVPGVAANADELAALRAEIARLQAQMSKTPAKGEKG